MLNNFVILTVCGGFLSFSKKMFVRKGLTILLAITFTAIEFAVLLTFLNMYNFLSIELYWMGLIALLAVFFVSVTILQIVVTLKSEK
jgi:hypothetical protein